MNAALRAVAVGRKNWLFAGSDAGGRTAVVLYTITQTCRRYGHDPFVYLRDILVRLPNTTSVDPSPYLPHRWTAPRSLTEFESGRRFTGPPDGYVHRP